MVPIVKAPDIIAALRLPSILCTALAYDSCTSYNDGMDHSRTPFGRPLTAAEEREQIRSEIIAAENRFTAGLGIDMSKVSREEFVRQVRELSHQRHPELAPKKKG